MIKKILSNRRVLLSSLMAIGGIGALAGLFIRREKSSESEGEKMANVILKTFPLGFQWPVQEPFLFCVHHHDLYPKGTAAYGPESIHLQGRDMGQDFEGKDGFRMYHGMEVPGFPVHPHRGFETVTVVRQGYVDHADSLGAAGRYGEGDVQWMTAGSGVQHSEMFPLLKKDDANTLELFQIWLNLPRKHKMSKAYFKMLWSEEIPKLSFDSSRVSVSLIAGDLGAEGAKAVAPPPESWAADPANEVAILLVKMAKDGTIKIPRSKGPAGRMLYFFEGSEITVNGQKVGGQTGLQLDSQQDLELTSPSGATEVLMLQAKSIGEPVVQHGPFVMNTKEEIVQTFADYRRSEFGGWPWPRHDMVHGPTIERFAKYPDGKIEKRAAPGTKKA